MVGLNEALDLILFGFLKVLALFVVVVVALAIGAILLASAAAIKGRYRFPFGGFFAAHVFLIPVVGLVATYHMLFGFNITASTYQNVGVGLGFYFVVWVFLLVLDGLHQLASVEDVPGYDRGPGRR